MVVVILMTFVNLCKKGDEERLVPIEHPSPGSQPDFVKNVNEKKNLI